MTKKTDANLMRVALNKTWNVTHNIEYGKEGKEGLFLLYTRVIRTLILGNYRQVIRIYKHEYPNLKYLNKVLLNKESNFNLKAAKEILISANKAYAHKVEIIYSNENVTINIVTKKPNLLLGKEGKMLNNLLDFISKL